MSDLPAIRRRLQLLDEEKELLLAHLAFLQVASEPDSRAKFANSYSGHVVNRWIFETAHLAVMTLERIWDRHESNPVTICDKAQLHIRALVQEMHRDFPRRGDPEVEIETRSRDLKELTARCIAYADSPLRSRIRLLRHETLAHNLDGASRERKKLKFEGPLSVQLSEVMEAAATAIALMDDLVQLILFRSASSAEGLRVQTSYARMFWNALPTLAEAEDKSLLALP